VPISHALARFPITPNMISIFTLAVGIAAGAFYACGGYWNTLMGAVLSVGASILDGCDGEIARLKLLESDFGCWLETICDYLYYLLIFAGLTIGLARSSGKDTYLDWGIVLLAGAVMSILVTGIGRHWLSGRRPEQYLGIWQKKAETRKSNPILYLGRHTEFIIRRCFLPYALLVFALLDLSRIVLFLAAIGANLVWLISLYSYLAFSMTPKSPSTDFHVAARTAPEAEGVTPA
jgi:phosphatidylglycerophosphate synthase